MRVSAVNSENACAAGLDRKQKVIIPEVSQLGQQSTRIKKKMRFAHRSISRFSNPAACPGAEIGLARLLRNVSVLSTLRSK